MKAAASGQAVPWEIRFLLAIAAWLLPRSLRGEWRREWLAEFSHVFTEVDAHPPPAARRQRMFARAAGAFPDAWTLLKLHGLRRRAEAAHSRLTPVVVPALLLLTLAVVTDGFQRARELLLQPESEDLVLLVQPVPFMGLSSRVPSAQAERWLLTGSTPAAIGAWTVERPAVDGQDVRVWRPTPKALALFAESRIQPQYDRVEPFRGSMPRHAGVVAKLRPGATLRQAEAELAVTAEFQKGWHKPHVVALASIRRAPLLPVGLLLGGLSLLSVLPIRVRSIQAGLWALAPVCLGFAVIAGVWLECVARAPVTEMARVPEAWNLALYVLPVVVASLTACWFWRTAGRRCRICYRPLMDAVTVGMEGHCLLEPGGREYLCVEGHGSLVEGSAAQNQSYEVWTSWSSSWA